MHLSANRKLEKQCDTEDFFVGGRSARKEIESRVMPKNSMEVQGPEVFFSDSGTASSVKT